MKNIGEKELALRQEICEVAHRMYEAGFSPANSGNISGRLGEGQYLITPSGVCKKDLTPDMLVKIDDGCNPIDGGKASSEARVHVYCYQHRPDVMGVCHSHAPFGLCLDGSHSGPVNHAGTGGIVGRRTPVRIPDVRHTGGGGIHGALY